MRRLALAVLVFAAGSTAWAAQPPAPSANKGRTGTYECKTGHAEYNYYVYVPKAYSDENPAGLHVYFHGQGGGGSAPHFGQWAKYFLEPHNLIGINMQYTDGDNGKDTAGKVDAAVEAIRQTMADYKIVFGRGAVASFSGGGLPHEQLFSKFGKFTPGGPSPSPFNHSALYGSNYWGNPTAGPPMTWFVGVGTQEWGMGQPTLGTSQTKKAEQLLAFALKGGCADVYYKVTVGKGHTISDEDVRDSAAQFRRSDLAMAPFLYERDYADPRLRLAARRANAHDLAGALSGIDRVLADAKADDAVKAGATAIKAKIEERVGAVLALMKELAENDPVLCAYYGNVFTGHLRNLPQAKDLKALLAESRKQPNAAAAGAAFREFCTSFKNVFGPGPSLKSGAAKFLGGVKTRAGGRSVLGTMATEFLAIEQPAPKAG
ncbi:MAG TPA: hypothetical protein VM431_13555 [Phycisphaerae bacterium]|nr:hypothetical protein [Phycisphaerae bacterium]